MSSQPASFLDNLRLVTCVTLLKVYVVPKTKLHARLAKLFGSKTPTLQHMLANASVRWAVTSGPALEVKDMIRGCPTLIDEGVDSAEIATKAFRGLYVTRYPNPTHIIFYIHGGGFVSGSPEAISPYLLQLGVELQARGVKADIFSAGYDLAPENPFPRALEQIASAFREHLSRRGKPIIMVSDSAGGNLTLAFLRHLVDPHPEVPACDDQNEASRVIAACLASPWVDLRNSSDSMIRNAGHDCLDKPALDRWRNAYLGERALDSWASPAAYEGSWREIMPRNVLLMSGELDMFLSDVVSLFRSMKKDGVESIDLCVEPLKGHVWHLIDFGGTIPEKEASLADEGEAGAYTGVVLQADWISRCCVE